MIMPVHRVRVMSSSSSRPQLTVPSPSPFCPSSSSSNKRKLRGTFTPKTTQNRIYRYVCCFSMSPLRSINYKKNPTSISHMVAPYDMCLHYDVHEHCNLFLSRSAAHRQRCAAVNTHTRGPNVYNPQLKSKALSKCTISSSLNNFLLKSTAPGCFMKATRCL